MRDVVAEEAMDYRLDPQLVLHCQKSVSESEKLSASLLSNFLRRKCSV